jgi:hypothetical protein
MSDVYIETMSEKDPYQKAGKNPDKNITSKMLRQWIRQNTLRSEKIKRGIGKEGKVLSKLGGAVEAATASLKETKKGYRALLKATERGIPVTSKDLWKQTPKINWRMQLREKAEHRLATKHMMREQTEGLQAERRVKFARRNLGRVSRRLRGRGALGIIGIIPLLLRNE